MRPGDAALRYIEHGFRVFPVKLDKTPATAHGCKDASCSHDVVLSWRGLFNAGGVGIACGGPMGLLVVDLDRKKNLNGFEEISKYGVLPEGPRVITPSGGMHIYLRLNTEDAAKVKNAVGLLPGVDLRWDGGYVVAPPTPNYAWLDNINPLDADKITIPLAPAWLLALLDKKYGARPKGQNVQVGEFFTEGHRNASLASIAGAMRKRGLDVPVITECLLVVNKEKCHPPLPEDEVRNIAKSIGRYPAEKPGATHDLEDKSKEWPRLDPRAYYGVLGEMVQAIAPHSEADPVGMLLTSLACAGNVIGRGIHYKVEGDLHFGNIFVCLVGDTAKGRKGTSWGRIRSLIVDGDPTWSSRIAGGLSSGEGLIYAIRDPSEMTVVDKKTGKASNQIADLGVKDKRLMCYVPEFGGILKIVKREGNTLSATLRCAWDTGDLRVLTKNSPLHATGGHVSVVAHVTSDELRKHMDEVEIANGLGNRFLWAVVKRSQYLPISAGVPQLDEHLARIKAAISHAQSQPRLIEMTAEAEELWGESYVALSEGRPGLAGALTARSEAQTIRLAIIYAVFDHSDVITTDHLTAALCVMDFCRKSVSHIWGVAIGDAKADMIFASLMASSEGLSMADLHALFGRNLPASELHARLALLARLGMVEVVPGEQGRVGRRGITWRAVPAGAKLRSVIPP